MLDVTTTAGAAWPVSIIIQLATKRNPQDTAVVSQECFFPSWSMVFLACHHNAYREYMQSGVLTQNMTTAVTFLRTFVKPHRGAFTRSWQQPLTEHSIFIFCVHEQAVRVNELMVCSIRSVSREWAGYVLFFSVRRLSTTERAKRDIKRLHKETRAPTTRRLSHADCMLSIADPQVLPQTRLR